MERRYQVFVSSTYEDLLDERREVMQALLELDCIPSGMELFPAADDDQWTLIKRVIDECDYYVLIVGGRYGTRSSGGKSFTQLEYEYAILRGKPIIGFLHKDPAQIPAARCEETDDGRRLLREFRSLVERKLVRHWMSAEDLGAVVSRSLVKLIKAAPAVGWIRGDEGIGEEASREILRLRSEVDRLSALLDSARVRPPEGTENLAQGEDDFRVQCTAAVEERTEEETVHLDYWAVMKWNEILGAVGPIMLDEGSEKAIKATLDAYVSQKFWASASQQHHEIGRLERLTVDAESFHTMKIQLRALGLIRKSDKRRQIRDSATYWTLTPFGDATLTKLRAVRRETDSRSSPTAT